jgi:hypothetical protein
MGGSCPYRRLDPDMLIAPIVNSTRFCGSRRAGIYDRNSDQKANRTSFFASGNAFRRNYMSSQGVRTKNLNLHIMAMKPAENSV